mmetsp:Transcript_7934/g.29349  ORF Transcript_7934/g.29349 Transcript_7934/m.29349 type:complete len:358 (+) Transcript_7934:5035-6108(+)
MADASTPVPGDKAASAAGFSSAERPAATTAVGLATSVPIAANGTGVAPAKGLSSGWMPGTSFPVSRVARGALVLMSPGNKVALGETVGTEAQGPVPDGPTPSTVSFVFTTSMHGVVAWAGADSSPSLAAASLGKAMAASLIATDGSPCLTSGTFSCCLPSTFGETEISGSLFCFPRTFTSDSPHPECLRLVDGSADSQVSFPVEPMGDANGDSFPDFAGSSLSLAAAALRVSDLVSTLRAPCVFPCSCALLFFNNALAAAAAAAAAVAADATLAAVTGGGVEREGMTLATPESFSPLPGTLATSSPPRALAASRFCRELSILSACLAACSAAELASRCVGFVGAAHLERPPEARRCG